MPAGSACPARTISRLSALCLLSASQGATKGLSDITNGKTAAYAGKKEVAAGAKEPVDKADLADVGNAQAMIPYLADIQRHYRESEVRDRHGRRSPPARAAVPTSGLGQSTAACFSPALLSKARNVEGRDHTHHTHTTPTRRWELKQRLRKLLRARRA